MTEVASRKPDVASLVGGEDQFPLTPKTRHSARWIALSIAVVVAAIGILLATRPPAAIEEANSPLIGKMAPPITATTFSGKPFSLSALRGKFVVLNFFASWCPPCMQEEPHLVEFAYQHEKEGNAVVVGVAFDDPTSEAAAFYRSTGALWQGISDPGGKIAFLYGVRGPPETFIITPGGRVFAHIDGPVTASYLNSLLTQAKAEGA
ncbi:MAG: TlpA family protein disulfide reductase [Actinobacteria bacterium]|nr:TlpA family protein disulfide reductase [Actinomycetota bacterium]